MHSEYTTHTNIQKTKKKESDHTMGDSYSGRDGEYQENQLEMQLACNSFRITR